MLEFGVLVSDCCTFSVTTQMLDDYAKADVSNPDTLIMNVKYICNKCGEETTVSTYKEPELLTNDLTLFEKIKKFVLSILEL